MKCHHLVSELLVLQDEQLGLLNFQFFCISYCHFNSLLVLLFLYFKLFLVCLWKIQQSTIVQLILNKFCAACDRIPYTIVWLFFFQEIESLLLSYNCFILCFESLFSESINVVSSHVNPYLSTILSSPIIGLIVSCFWVSLNCLNLLFFDPLVPFYFQFEFIIVSQFLHNFRSYNSIVLKFGYLAVFPVFQNSPVSSLCSGCFCFKKIFPLIGNL